jgi:hypothetical protein
MSGQGFPGRPVQPRSQLAINNDNSSCRKDRTLQQFKQKERARTETSQVRPQQQCQHASAPQCVHSAICCESLHSDHHL